MSFWLTSWWCCFAVHEFWTITLSFILHHCLCSQALKQFISAPGDDQEAAIDLAIETVSRPCAVEARNLLELRMKKKPTLLFFFFVRVSWLIGRNFFWRKYNVCKRSPWVKGLPHLSSVFLSLFQSLNLSITVSFTNSQWEKLYRTNTVADLSEGVDCLHRDWDGPSGQGCCDCGFLLILMFTGEQGEEWQFDTSAHWFLDGRARRWSKGQIIFSLRSLLECRLKLTGMGPCGSLVCTQLAQTYTRTIVNEASCKCLFKSRCCKPE